MHKSFIERIFPHSPDGGLPRYEDDSPARTSTSGSAKRIQLRDSSLSPPARSPSRKYVQPSPLSASFAHHDNPFLAVERAAKALQRTIQSYLDAQSDGLHASLADTGPDDHSSVGSPTPTPSTTTPSRNSSLPKTVPVRQPVPRKITLRGARRGLGKAMEEFAQLRQEELSIIDSESASRQNALKRGRRFQEKRNSLIREMDSIRGEDYATQATTYRQEADKVKVEIQEVEATLFELRARYRQLITQADQHENTMDSKLSSYKSSLSIVENDMKLFLRHPPIDYSLPLFDNSGPGQGSMYALKPERRTLEMAQEQWTVEQELLAHRKADVEIERQALQEGVKIWHEATRLINEFEKTLRRALRHPLVTTTGSAGSPSSNYEERHSALLSQLNDLIASLQVDLATAESNSWNLLICCLGAELEALDQGRILLGGAPQEADIVNGNTQASAPESLDGESASEKPSEDLLNRDAPESPGTGSNQSLEDTLAAFGDATKVKGKEAVRSPIADDGTAAAEAKVTPARSKPAVARDESEDDDPGPDFFLSSH